MKSITANPCNICPRECGVDRTRGQMGVCGTNDKIRLARAALHMWEEPCISGVQGSGTVFFTGCALKCIYCQNHKIASGNIGKEVTSERLTEIFLELQEQGAANINLVTPSHYVTEIIPALARAKLKGLTIPIVYNCSGYEKTAALQKLAGYIDIYLTDFKYMDPQLAGAYSAAPDYPEIARKALAEMVIQTGKVVFDPNGIMKKGVLVRHLLLPGSVKNARCIIQYLHETYGSQIYLSIMNQYTPVLSPELGKTPPQLTRPVTSREYNKLLSYCFDLGIENAFIQEGPTAQESFIPPFDYQGV